MSTEEEVDNATVAIIVRTLDSWYLMSPELVHDAVMAWLDSLSCDCPADEPDAVLEAKEIG